MTNYCYMWLPKGANLIKLVSKGITMYCHLLAYILKGMLGKIRKKCFSFLWIGKTEKEGIPRVKWKNWKKVKKRCLA